MAWMLGLVAACAVAGARGTRPVGEFLPSVHGFGFVNRFTGSPLPFGPAGLGGLAGRLGAPATFGLCGGMASTAADCFLAGAPVPPGDRPPVRGEALYAHLYARQIASLGPNLEQAGRFIGWMATPDGGPWGTRERTIAGLPSVRAALDAGRPALLGLVYTSFATTREPWTNHQVLAFAAADEPAAGTGAWARALGVGGAATLRLYDPNFPGRDDVVLRCEGRTVGVRWAPLLWPWWAPLPVRGMVTTEVVPGVRRIPVRGFFLMPYEAAAPPRTRAPGSTPPRPGR